MCIPIIVTTVSESIWRERWSRGQADVGLEVDTGSVSLVGAKLLGGMGIGKDEVRESQADLTKVRGGGDGEERGKEGKSLA